MVQIRQLRQLIGIVALVILGGFLFSVMPCADAHAESHPAEAVCVCICCDGPITQVVSDAKAPLVVPSSGMARIHADDPWSPRQIVFSLLQPPKFS